MVVGLRKRNSRGSSLRHDVLVVGAGPAGLSIAAEFAKLGCQTAVIAPGIGERWERSFGAFERDISGLDVEAALLRRYSRPRVEAQGGQVVSLSESYVRFDTSRLQSLLLSRAEVSGVRFLSGEVSAVHQSGALTTCEAQLEPGPGEGGASASPTTLEAGIVVNAAGGAAGFGTEKKRKPSGFQSAYGQWIDVEAHPFGEGEMSLMDYRTVDGAPAGPPSFLYALPETGQPGGPGTLFVQETVLVSSEPVPMALLAERMQLRLAALGVESKRVLGTERCVIPMGGELPVRSSAVLPFGAAAGLVHPATGYQLTRALHLAKEVAAAAVEGSRKNPSHGVAAGIDAMWPERMRHSWAFFELGAATLGSLNPEVMSDFIFEFFSLPGGRWQRFMAGTMEAGEIAETMWRVFAHAPGPLRRQLLRGGSSVATRFLAQRLA